MGVQSSPPTRAFAALDMGLNSATPTSAFTCEDQVIDCHASIALEYHHYSTLSYGEIETAWEKAQGDPSVAYWVVFFSLHRLCRVSTCKETFFFIALFQESYARRLKQEKPPCEQNSALEDFEIHAKCDLKPGIQTQDY